MHCAALLTTRQRPTVQSLLCVSLSLCMCLCFVFCCRVRAVQVSFAVPVCVRAVSLTFQGGFVGTSVQLAVTTADASPKRFVAAHTWEPRDCNHLQRFEVQPPQNSVTNLRLIFPQSTDFFGRITLYALDIEGAPADAAAAPDDQPAQATSSLA